MKNRVVKLLLIILVVLFVDGCYTQIMITSASENPEQTWEKENYSPGYYHNRCHWCSRWNYYYSYPWWLDQYWWWDHHYSEPISPDRREKYERRRGLDNAIDNIIETIDAIDGIDESRERNDASNPSDTQNDDDDNGNNNTNDRAPRRRGLD
ncbi:hypothetical protein KAH81_09335 [bacterium]|nr:hypothetical protein [bacterium]